MANHPNILVFGLPAREELFLRQWLGPDDLERVGVYDSLEALSQDVNMTVREFREAITLVFLDRSYDIRARTHTPRNGVSTSFSSQVKSILSLLPNAEILCATNSPLRFSQEEVVKVPFGPRFCGVVSYASLHQNTHFIAAPKK